MKYRIKHSVHIIAYTGKFTYYTINASQTMELKSWKDASSVLR